MNQKEYNMLVNRIQDADLESGKVIKSGGQWYVQGKPSTVPAPVINMPHWTEGTKKVTIEGKR